MNFYLENFEIIFPPELMAQGENLYESGAIQHFKEIERNLWSFDIKHDESYEIEILISPSRVKSYSCDCEAYKVDKNCSHIIAALFQLRNVKTKRIKKSLKKVKEVPKKLSVVSILNQVQTKDLKNFIRSYAQKNKHFSTSLKANFARTIDLENNAEKYEGILNAIVKPATGVDYKVSHLTIKHFMQVAEQFDAQYEDAVSLKQYREAYYIIKSLLNKIAYINHWTLSENEEVKKMNSHLHYQFNFLLKLAIAPELREEIYEYGIDLSSRTYYHVTSIKDNLFFLLHAHIYKEDQNIRLVEILQIKLKSELVHDFELEKLWVLRQYFIDKEMSFQPQATPTFSSQSVYRITDHLEKLAAYDGLKAFLELFKYKGKIHDAFLVKKYLNVLYKLGLRETLIQECFENLMLHKDVFFYDLLKKSFPESQDVFFKKAKSLIKSKRSIEYQNLYLQILVSDSNIDELNTYLVESNFGLQHLLRHAEFINEHSGQLAEIVVQVTDNYLSEYMGIESAQEMKNLLIFLKKNKWDNAFSKLKKHLQHNFADRKSIKEEIVNV